MVQGRRADKEFDGLPVIIRVCLKCNKEFRSIGNRICDRCHERNKGVGRMVERGMAIRVTQPVSGGD